MTGKHTSSLEPALAAAFLAAAFLGGTASESDSEALASLALLSEPDSADDADERMGFYKQKQTNVGPLS